MGCQSFRSGTGTELSHLMRDRMEFWLKMGSFLLLSQRIISAYQVICSHRTPADLRWIIVNSKSNSVYLWADGMRRWPLQIKAKLNEILPPFHVAVESSGWQFCVFGFFFFFFFSALLLLNFLPNSFFPLFRMITSPKNVFLQVFNTLVFEAQSKCLLLSVLCCSKC